MTNHEQLSKDILIGRSKMLEEVEKMLFSVSDNVLKDVPRGKTIDIYYILEGISRHFDSEKTNQTQK